jgi:hypothetical protein
LARAAVVEIELRGTWRLLTKTRAMRLRLTSQNNTVISVDVFGGLTVEADLVLDDGSEGISCED